MSTSWYVHPGEKVMQGFNVNEYSKYGRFNPESANSVTNVTYLVFLGLVLIIWWLSITEELRQCTSWWMVMFLMPSKTTNIKHEGGQIFIESISRSRKALIFIVSL